MTRLRAGVIGLGVGEKHAEALRAHPDCELAVLCDRDPARLREVMQRFPGVRGIERDQDVLRDPGIDLVCIASHDNFHFEQTIEALEYGKHVFVEKPFVVQPDEARAVRQMLRRRSSLRLSSNLVLRASPRFADLKGRIESGELGRLFCLEADYNYGRLHKITEGWRGKLDFYSAVHGGGVHVVDLLMWLADERIVEVSAFGTAIASEGSGFQNFDTVVAALRFAGGAVGKIGVNFGCMFPHFHNVLVYGTQATFVNGLEHALLYTSRDPAQAPVRLDTGYRGTHKGALIGGFVDALLERGPPPVDEEAVFAGLSVCFAIEQSAHSGRPVTVDYL